MIPDKAVQAAHAAICEQNLDECLDPDWRGKCVKAVEAASGVMVDRLQAAVSAVLELAQEWKDDRANIERTYDYTYDRLDVLDDAAQEIRDAIGSALRGQE